MPEPSAGAAVDVLGLGVASVDDLLYVARHPGADGKAPVHERRRAFGGLTATALVAAARLGARCAFAGRLGLDELSTAVAENFAREGIDTARAPRDPIGGIVHATIVVAAQPPSRAIYFAATGAVGAHDSLPSEEAILAAKVLFLDHCGVPGGLRATRIARRHGVSVVADLEDDSDPLFSELLAEIDHLVLSREFAAQITGLDDPTAMARRLWSPRRAAIVITGGAEGCWWTGDGEEVLHQRAFPVTVIDTTGCGDVFHGAYAAGLAQGLSAPERIRRAAAAAALKATRPGGQAGCPSARELDAFLATHPVKPLTARHLARSMR
jgi:sugar/nucleoside kinase (ribokinase family)